MTRYEVAPCPACGAGAATLVANRDDIRTELEQLWAFHTKRIHGDTSPRRLHDRIAFTQRPPLQLVRCDGCSLLYRNPRERADTLVEAYRAEQPDECALTALRETQRRSYRRQARRLTRVFGRSGTGLEVGSYVGGFLAAAREEGWDFGGIDINGSASEFALAAGYQVRTVTIEESDASRRYDVVAFWNCFDQLPDPVSAARAARARLHTGGMVAIRVPSGVFYEHWRRRLRPPLRPLARSLLAHNNLLGFPYRHGFSLHSLSRLLEHAGFAVAAAIGDTLVPVADESTRAWARVEERLIKSALRQLPARHAPWLEVYARALPL